ncbi:hypothetical protein GUITHDRAFT_145191 [Guillardia theta CCMP2712]|uniref:Uncharacterized protein n=1 Tax=Guillardia theta (strain CCMP2712) TaxID=905079 RepID=L1ILU8_GUITC|nr:hypothetical protein GUITHDRAFT_145191 [Guillardia theta CCMP2712]EKX37238.1 hypothetical protein GUITHDRAFT_145191 [Guillardia theta CCMP2712]|eukprot:XP_005824218.1 hypothetical protein GUITHDRAFT_145191 [Guillardia theta CCMP2712]
MARFLCFLFLAAAVAMTMSEEGGGGGGGERRVIFHNPQTHQRVSGRSFTIEVEVQGFSLPEEGKGLLLLDGRKLMEIRSSRMTVGMDGAGGLSEGEHILKLSVEDVQGRQVVEGEVRFFKEGAPEESAGPFHDGRWDDENFVERQQMQEECGKLSALDIQAAGGKGGNVTVIALGLPVVSSRKKYDGEEEDDMRVVQSREEYIEDIEKLPMMKVFIPSLVEKLQHEQGKYRYDVYLGFDKGDPVFDNDEMRREVHSAFAADYKEDEIDNFFVANHVSLVSV